MSFGTQHKISYADITDTLSDDLLAPIDRDGFTATNTYQEQWQAAGLVYLRKFIPDDLIDAYCEVRSQLNSPGGWRSPTPYVHVKELRDICLYEPLMEVMKELISEPVGLHLNLTGWVSTERDFHSDSYLNPPNVGSHYIAAWFALDNIHPDSGPFQYALASHKWPVIRRDKVFKHLTPEEQQDEGWPTYTQRWIADACMQEAVDRNTPIMTYTPRRGDLLLWHSQLVHRGSPARNPGMERKALIAHYSAISKRPDMPVVKEHENGQKYFWFPRDLE